MKIVPVRGHERGALVDDEDLDLVSRYRWKVLDDGHNVYAAASDMGVTVYMHRVIARARRRERVDHRNRDGLDNQKSNLRIATVSQNGANSRKRRDAQSSGYRGVSRSATAKEKPWRAAVTHRGKYFQIGFYRSAEEAAIAYDCVARAIWGEFASLNFPVANVLQTNGRRHLGGIQ